MHKTFRGLQGVFDILAEAALPIISPPGSTTGPMVGWVRDTLSAAPDWGPRGLFPPEVLYKHVAWKGSLGFNQIQKGPAGREPYEFFLSFLFSTACKGAKGAWGCVVVPMNGPSAQSWPDLFWVRQWHWGSRAQRAQHRWSSAVGTGHFPFASFDGFLSRATSDVGSLDAGIAEAFSLPVLSARRCPSHLSALPWGHGF